MTNAFSYIVVVVCFYYFSFFVFVLVSCVLFLKVDAMRHAQGTEYREGGGGFEGVAA